MSNPVDHIEQHPKQTTRILGINYHYWKKLVERAIAYHEQQQKKLEKSKIRINAPGGRRKAILTLEYRTSLLDQTLHLFP